MSDLAARVIELAAALAREAGRRQTGKERREASRLARMLADPAGKAFTLELVDRVFRSDRAPAQAHRFRELFGKFGAPRYLSIVERLMLWAGAMASAVVPGVVMPAISARLRRDCASVILSGEAEPLARYLAKRAEQRTQVNINQLGEAVLGEEEAARRLDAILGHLANPAIRCVSVKGSALFSQINLLDWEGTLEAICDRLRRLYRAALPERKRVNLDMEEYRDLELTLAAFQRTLDEPEFQSLEAGVVLQAYLPDSWTAQQRLIEWARARVTAGGAPVRLRIVKGANLAMEKVEAELHGLASAPYQTKAETDANFRRMLELGCRPESAAVVRVGVGSHNLFDVALALELRRDGGTERLVEIEMLEGMAPHQARAVQAEAGGLLVYAPVVKREDFKSAMAYLVRRLDENTAPENFLRDLFDLTPGSPAWSRQEERFVAGWRDRLLAGAASHRGAPAVRRAPGFANTPDTDWTQSANREELGWALGRPAPPAPPPASPLADVLGEAEGAQRSWESLGFDQRAIILRRCAEVMEQQRFETIALMVRDGKKAVTEADAEVSEAVDFANYYAQFHPPAGVRAKALGVVAVTPPWNFPYAIPCSGVLAALMAGNVVILKPAPETVATAWRLAQQLWQGGIPRDALQFFPCADGEIGRALITHPRISAVVLTGAYDTARLFQSWRPSLRLYAETSGKNALIITAQADRELAIKDLVRSAFGHAGQKCSAASLGILEAEVYDDPVFRRQLRDAAASLRVGPSEHPASLVTPLIREPSPDLLRALTTLDPGEEWLLEPRPHSDDPCLWSPGIKLGVQPGSWFHRHECFGPVLGLIRAVNLDDATQIQNASDYGLTGGIHSLDEVEIAYWREWVEVGNAYINRAITGAIVQRQPFGGWKRSCIGPGAKAGGPNYVGLFVDWIDENPGPLHDAAADFAEAWRAHFSREHDPSALRCETNVFRYRPRGDVVLRLEAGEAEALELARLAAETCGARLWVSQAETETEEQFIARIPEISPEAEVFRTLRAPSDAMLAAVHAKGWRWINAPISRCGRIELTRWLREQSVSETRHRYGQVLEPPPIQKYPKRDPADSLSL